MAVEIYDVVIKDGRIMDPETATDARMNVGIRNGTISAITSENVSGTEEIDASGLVVCPGFIDMHHHNSGVPFGEKLALRDGVTTPLELEAGITSVRDWYDALKGKCRTNYGASVGSIPVREHIFNPAYTTRYAGDFLYDLMAGGANTTMSWSTQKASASDLKMFESKLREGLDEGAIGIGHAVGYMVAGCTQQESMICQKLAGQNGHSVYLHGRFSSQMPPASGILGTLEMMGPQEVYGGGLVVQHITAQTLNDTAAALELINRARAKGINVLAEVYPYDFGGSIVGADYLHPDNYGPNMGRDYKDIIETATMTPLTEERYAELVKTAPGTSILFYNATEETVHMALSDEQTVLGSDAFPYNLRTTGEVALDWNTPFDAVNGHPRGAGSHARLLRWVREGTVSVSLMNAIGKMSYFIADFLQENGVPGMAQKGRIQIGMDADITLFDPDMVTDNATMQDGGLPSTGIPYVLVNGTLVVRQGETVDDVFPGQPVYGKGLAA
ncbi:MAG: amidohydrolase family protein [Roseibium sp.]|uniref:amidohydrolase family protein n=1 Tax=Roseibium sp. TaxID=1936156 RepID=UPI003D9C5946